MSRHTPGPWQHKPNGELTFIPIKAIYCERIGFQLGFINTDSKTREEQAEANARLIAAAPDLLIALKLMLESHDASCPGESCQIIGVDIARAAIAKAEGK